MKIPVISIGVLPLTETSRDLPPAGLGLTPSGGFFGRTKESLLRLVADKVLFRKPTRVMTDLLNSHNIQTDGSNVFDILVRKSTLLLQSGTPGFEYNRSDLGKNIRFIGALLPHTTKKDVQPWFDEKLTQFSKIILVTQGTVERDISKLLVPTLEAFKDSEYLIVATTGGSRTKELREKYAGDNVIIEDFIPFADIMPYVDVYVTNGGYGGVMLSIENKLPMVVAGIHEGKNEINARVGYFKLGVNLHTETPTIVQIKNGVEKILHDNTYYHHVKKLSSEFAMYNPNELCARYVEEVLSTRHVTRETVYDKAS
jgi:UDP:flavonoid glycosyltransferase YjiC (YdhE family)